MSYNLTEEAFQVLALGFSGKDALEFRVKYVQAFNEMKKIIQEQSYEPQLPNVNPRMTIMQGHTPARKIDKHGRAVYSLNDLRRSPFLADQDMYDKCIKHLEKHGNK